LEEAPEKQLKVGNSASSVGKSQRKGCYYTSIPRVVKCKGMSGQELTSLNLDKVGIHTLLNVWSLKSNCDKRLTTINSLTLNFTYYCLLICALFWCTFSDTIIRNLTGKRLWRFWRHASWRTAVCICCLFGIVNEMYFVYIFCWLLFNPMWHFAMAQMGQSLEAFLQWKSLVSLLFGCTEAVSITF